MIKLQDIYNEVWEGLVIPANVEDIFYKIINRNIKEIIVNQKELNIIIQCFVINYGNTDFGVKVFCNWKLDKFMGVKLILE